LFNLPSLIINQAIAKSYDLKHFTLILINLIINQPSFEITKFKSCITCGIGGTQQKPALENIPTGWFDGATSENGTQSGAGGLLKISQNTFYKWTYNCGPCTNTRAERLGAWATLFLASRIHIDVLQVVGDTSIVIEWLRNRGDLEVVSLLAWKDKIRNLQHTFQKLNFIHTHREHNKSVHHLSKEALHKRVGHISYSLWIDGHEGSSLTLSLL
jgi:ribonuclease HI